MRTKDLMMGFVLVAVVGAKAGRAEENKYVVSCIQRGGSDQAITQLDIYRKSDGRYAYVASKCKDFLGTPCFDGLGVVTYENSGEVEPSLYNGHLTGIFNNDDIKTFFICGRDFAFRDEMHDVRFVFQADECDLSLE
jgi:hypothetical protein